MVENSDSILWEEMPEDLQEDILTWLPAQGLCRFRGTCKQWNSLCSSSCFITRQWAQQSPNRNPCLVLSNENSVEIPWMTYCFITQTWKAFISLSFLLSGYEWQEYRVNCEVSSSGIFLVDVCPSSSEASFNTVFNPLTQTALILPRMSSMTIIRARGIVGVDGHTENDTYKVVAVGRSGPRNGMIVEIYDSYEKSWSVAGTLPHGLDLIGKMVCCAGFFYILIRIQQQKMLMSFYVKEGTFILTPLPVPQVADSRMLPQLVTCRSRILIAGKVFEPFNEGEVLKEVIVWELKESSWEEIVRMPPSILEDFKRKSTDTCLNCTGVKDCLFFRGGFHIVVYDLTKASWTWLPRCPIDATTSMAFEPRPDMKIN